MKDQELRELDAWIAEHVMGWLFNRHGIPFSPHPDDKWQAETVVPRYTTDPAAAMAVLEKCFEKVGLIDMARVKIKPFNFVIGATYVVDSEVEASTLPLAICLFAKQLFSKETK